MVPVGTGRTGPRTGNERRCYRPAVPQPLTRSAALAAVALSAVVVAACLPSPNAPTSPAAPSPSTGQVAGSPRPSATPKPHVAAVAAFARNAAGGSWTYRMAFKGSLRAAADTIPINGTMDVAGADYAASMTYDFRRDYPHVGRIRVQVRAVRGRGYVKRGSTAWRSVAGYAKGQSFVPFRTVKGPDDVRFMGDVKVAGKTLHKIGIPGAVVLHPNTVPGLLQKEKVRVTELEVLIDAAGRPRSGTWKMWGTGRVGVGAGQLQEIVYELKLSFARVGWKVSIRRP
jgi:hypothetical protein